MRTNIQTPHGTVSIGTRIYIRSMKGDTVPSKAFPGGIDHQAMAMNGKTGTVTSIDSIGQLHGTWGGLAVIPGIDEFSIVFD